MSDGYLALRRMVRLARGYAKYGAPLGDLVRELKATAPKLILNAPGAAIGALGVRFQPAFLQRDFNFETVFEPIPNPDSRVLLSTTKDRLGLRQVIVDWRLTDADKAHFKALHGLLVSDAPAQSGIQLVGDPVDVDEIWPDGIAGCWHHMGTTRMHQDPAKGVVDADCRVHGMANLYVAGSSVFPTVGSDTPTITIVALALRLSGAIQAALRPETARSPRLARQ
jgi:choline dehydrogenase-like flavoprotein